MRPVMRIVLFAFVALIGLSGPTAFAQVTVHDLGTLGGTSGSSYAYGISDAGHIVGKTTVSGGAEHAFRWISGTMTDLGTLTGYNDSAAYGINEDDDYVGYSMSETDEDYPILNMVSFISSASGGYESAAFDINNNGVVVGDLALSTSSSIIQAFIYTSAGGGSITYLANPLGPSGWPSHARGINDNGEVAGTGRVSVSGVGYDRAFFRSSTGTYTQIPTLGGVGGYGMGINSSGAVCGYSSNSMSHNHGFVYSGGSITDLGTITVVSNESYAFGINDSGVVVGCVGSGGWGSHAVMWSGGSIVDLNTTYASTGWNLFCATAINNYGQIVGYGYPPGKTVVHGFVIK